MRIKFGKRILMHMEIGKFSMVKHKHLSMFDFSNKDVPKKYIQERWTYRQILTERKERAYSRRFTG